MHESRTVGAGASPHDKTAWLDMRRIDSTAADQHKRLTAPSTIVRVRGTLLGQPLQPKAPTTDCKTDFCQRAKTPPLVKLQWW